jgi:hypothetical protein
MTVQEKFEVFHAANPHVYLMFKRFAYEALKVGATKISSKLIINRVRWETSITTTGAGWHVAGKKRFLIDDRFTCWYARLFIADFPRLASRFELREIRTP